ncbi:DNA-binding transcriptional response regulator, NtrC family, contains REC, AAA-type ATPase, and a Fis-type DNA-binding domains [Chryseobacterium piscicola]|uniref:DNA-binding transcriptional response regulator, NtrC family, contains REC, AAA-type ATPase, and a Fis-type DNA-binding domains n=1 Tax=Chryseobacterium piscicola TaxID=551459 RepID=A0A1N7KGQ5_9FLAO|nr:sigma-54 dependent transcriptional regulator [Chryseobacterium piscicola]PQA96312.1 sigma-54-dependent Fis family transcriptional regulator [Chryseobacterium piscicola]SIS60654.1 DNA-binding transcriptional response regulator, NtrC family, contains REC, AAA-type ATPase, and a Fis-type DNA-binding domains [Chryseobacterium piscicola]
MNTILIIDDEAKIRSLLSRIISLEGFQVFEASNLKAGLKRLELSDIEIVICDVKLPDGNGVEFSKIVKEKFPFVEIILLTAFGNIPDGVMAIKNGAFDYITKGDDNTKILPLIYKASDKVALNKRVIHLEKQLNNKQSFDSIIGKSDVLISAIDSAKKVSGTDATVLLTGETGTGKEVFAQAIHHSSKRCKRNFIAINCSAFGKDLLENELFGHKAGAFTGALKDSKGIFEEANQGTVFLDEIGEMPLDLQAKLLRVLESGEFLKVGDSKPTKTDVRIIAATNRNLKTEIENGNFREDLYYRINIFQIKLPSLRERVADIELLVKFFLKRFSLKSGKNITSVSSDYLKALKNHPWKGNIREFRNVIERSVILTDSSELEIDSLPLDISVYNNEIDSSQTKMMSAFSMATAEKMQIQKVLIHTKGNKAEAARLLEIGIATLYRKVEEYKIS